MAIIGTLLSVWLFAKKVGEDNFGNKYYLSKCLNAEKKPKRIILYKGVAEPSKIPPLWHSWIHYKTDVVPNSNTYQWQNKRTVNMTGTDLAYMPPGHVNKEAKHDRTINDYQPWQP
ncbi:MAG: NADH-ubiquinone oxidoreductase subunit NDUFA12 family protein [Rickettsiales endosymbiont of Dermacentor nuttalli]